MVIQKSSIGEVIVEEGESSRLRELKNHDDREGGQGAQRERLVVRHSSSLPQMTMMGATPQYYAGTSSSFLVDTILQLLIIPLRVTTRPTDIGHTHFIPP